MFTCKVKYVVEDFVTLTVFDNFEFELPMSVLPNGKNLIEGDELRFNVSQIINEEDLDCMYGGFIKNPPKKQFV